MANNPVSYFEIPVTDLKRAKAYYETVFRTRLELVDVDGNQMAMFPFAENGPGAAGALACGPSYVPGEVGTRVYFSVEDIDVTLDSAISEGGRPVYPVTEVPGYGWVAEFLDTEGNCIALYAAARQATGSP